MDTHTILKGLLKVAPTNEARAVLNGVHVTGSRMEATDGHLAVVVVHQTEGLDEEGVVLCRRGLAAALKCFSPKSELSISVGADGVATLQEGALGVRATVPTIPQPYLNLAKALANARRDAPTPPALGLDLRLMAKLCTAVDAVLGPREFHGARVTFHGDDGGCSISSGCVDAHLKPMRL